jgi:hypothetical protein
LLYQWRQDETELPGETDSTLVIFAADAANAGSYDVVVSNNSGSVTSEPATLNVLEPVTITSDPISVAITPGATAVFSVTAEGDAPLSYQWFYNGAPILGATRDTLTIANAQLVRPAATKSLSPIRSVPPPACRRP